MEIKVKTYETLSNLVKIDSEVHKVSEMASLFLTAMYDWSTLNQTDIFDFIKEVKDYFGTPLTIQKINSIKFNGKNAWQLESSASIVELINISIEYNNESEFDKIIDSFLNYYNEEFKKVDFIAELQYLSTEQGGRKTPAFSGYRPHIKFDFDEMLTSGQQTFIDRNEVFPGDKVDAKIKIVSDDYFKKLLSERIKFEFFEGQHIIGTGVIKYIVNNDLEK